MVTHPLLFGTRFAPWEFSCELHNFRASFDSQVDVQVVSQSSRKIDLQANDVKD